MRMEALIVNPPAPGFGIEGKPDRLTLGPNRMVNQFNAPQFKLVDQVIRMKDESTMSIVKQSEFKQFPAQTLLASPTINVKAKGGNVNVDGVNVVVKGQKVMLG